MGWDIYSEPQHIECLEKNNRDLKRNKTFLRQYSKFQDIIQNYSSLQSQENLNSHGQKQSIVANTEMREMLTLCNTILKHLS